MTTYEVTCDVCGGPLAWGVDHDTAHALSQDHEEEHNHHTEVWIEE